MLFHIIDDCFARSSGLSHHQCGEGELLASNGPTAALEFVIEVGEAADDAAEEGLAPAAATFGGVSLLAEQEVVLAECLRGVFGAHLLGGERHEVQ